MSEQAGILSLNLGIFKAFVEVKLVPEQQKLGILEEDDEFEEFPVEGRLLIIKLALTYPLQIGMMLERLESNN